jgi:hypothetical protein
LFYNQNKEYNDKDAAGTFSENIIENKNFILWNTIIGGGSADGYSDQTIVIVTVHTKGTSSDELKLKLTAKYENTILLSELKNIDCIGEEGDYKVLYLINNTGCDSITLEAELFKYNKSVSAMKKSINFSCGE